MTFFLKMLVGSHPRVLVCAVVTEWSLFYVMVIACVQEHCALLLYRWKGGDALIFAYGCYCFSWKLRLEESILALASSASASGRILTLMADSVAAIRWTVLSCG